MATPYRSVYLTFPDADSAQRIARALVDERLAACVTLLPGATSIYRWQGEVRHDAEVVGFAKTRAALVDRLTHRVNELHPYDTPCVVALSIAAGDAAYLRWIHEMTPG